MPKAFPEEFRRDVVAVARRREAPISQCIPPLRASSISAPSKMRSGVASSAYSIDSRMKASLAVAALNDAIALRGPVGTIVHSDHGSQFRSGKFVRALRSAGLIGSMGRTGACADNAAMESFFALVQRNVSTVSAA